jgi:4-amino-4-deoxychorismate lyase
VATLIDGLLTDTVPSSDRGLAYGDGLFETIALLNGHPRHFARHLKRLADGAARLGIPAPESARWEEDLARLVTATAPPARAVLKLILTRGSGGRGYLPPETAIPRRILQILPWPAPSPDGGRLGIVCQSRLGLNPLLAGLKHLNRLEQVLAAREVAAAGAWEGLMLDVRDQLVEGTRSNVFVVMEGEIFTPRLDSAGVSGVMRGILCEHATAWGMPIVETPIYIDRLEAVEEIFFSNSLRGIESLHRLRFAGRERPLETRYADALAQRLRLDDLWP